MALESLTVQAANRTGAEVALQAVTTVGGFQFPNDGKTILYVVNDAGALVLNFTVQPVVDGEAVDTKDVSVTASETWIIGPFPTQWYNNASGTCVVAVDADLAAGVTLIRTP